MFIGASDISACNIPQQFNSNRIPQGYFFFFEPRKQRELNKRKAKRIKQ
jgi:hypothetical protein